jgi:uncharacterized protein YjiS (DUF1127 family)
MKSQKGFVVTGSTCSAPVTAGSWQRIRTALRRWAELHRQRRLLAQLSDEGLKDLGLSRADIVGESQRPFWDDPLKH